MPELIVTFTPPDLPQRMARYPDLLAAETERTMTAALSHTQGSVPAYPPAPVGSRYVRTGTLGRSIGLGGQADIYTVEKIGSSYVATLGTRLAYAPRVIGEGQEPPWSGYWWKLSSVLKKAEPGITRLFEAMGRRLVARLGGG